MSNKVILKRIKQKIKKSLIDNNNLYINNNLPLYFYGHKCTIKKHYNDFIFKFNTTEELSYHPQGYKNLIKLTDEELEIYINNWDRINNTIYVNITGFLLTKNQIKKYTPDILMRQIFSIYTEEDGIDENFIKELLNEYPDLYLEQDLICSYRKLSSNLINYLIMNYSIMCYHLIILLKHQILNEDNIEVLLSKYNTMYIQDILKYQNDNISDELKTKLQILNKLI